MISFIVFACAFFFFTSQISLTLPQTLLSDSLLSLVKSGAKQISSCQNQPTNHWWWANVSALSAHGECSCFFFNSNPWCSSGKWWSVDCRQAWTAFWTWAYRVWQRMRVDHNFHTWCLYIHVRIKVRSIPGPAIILEIDVELHVVVSEQILDLCIYISLRTITDLFVKERKMRAFREPCRTRCVTHPREVRGHDWIKNFSSVSSAVVNIL